MSAVLALPLAWVVLACASGVLALPALASRSRHVTARSEPKVVPVAPWTWVEPAVADQPVAIATRDGRTLWQVGAGQYVLEAGGAWRPTTILAARQFLNERWTI